MRRWKKVFISFAIFAAIGFIFHASGVFAKFGLDETAGAAGLKPKVNKPLEAIVGDILGTALSLISVIFFILTLYGGFLWMTARGNSDQESKARDTIFGAVIGLIIVLAAYAITSFVFSNVATNVGTGNGGGGTPNASPVAVGDKDGAACKITANGSWAVGVDLVATDGQWNCQKSKGADCGGAGECQPTCRYSTKGGTGVCQADACPGKEGTGACGKGFCCDSSK